MTLKDYSVILHNMKKTQKKKSHLPSGFGVNLAFGNDVSKVEFSLVFNYERPRLFRAKDNGTEIDVLRRTNSVPERRKEDKKKRQRVK